MLSLNHWVTYLLGVFFVVIFMIPIVFVILRREYPEMKARSPYLTIICLVLLMLDAILNTWILFKDPHDDKDD